MAPKKKPSTISTTTTTTTTTLRRSTRVSTKVNPSPTPPEPTELPKRKKAKTTATKSVPEEPPVKKEEKAVSPVNENSGSDSTDVNMKKIVIEHCKQCNRFKRRAAEVQKGLEDAGVKVKVVVNPEKPRRGCFEVREDGGGEVFVSLQGLKRPFQQMMDLDLEKVVADIVAKI